MLSISLACKKHYTIPAVALLAVLAVELVGSVRQQSATFDESIILFSGYQQLRHRDFGANPEVPPVLKMMAAVPLLFLKLHPTVLVEGPTKRANTDYSIFFLFENQEDDEKMLFRSRMAASIYTYLLAILIYWCGYEMFGAKAALIALALFVFEPNMLAHGALVTTDVPVTCFMLAAVFAYYRYVKQPTRGRMVLCGIAVALACASKHNGLTVGPILVLLAIGGLLVRGKDAAIEGTQKETREALVRRSIRSGLGLVSIFAIGVIGLWAIYTFRFEARPDGAVLNPSLYAHALEIHNAAPRIAIVWLGRLKALPEAYLWGLTDILLNNQSRATFLFGKAYATSQWFYFPMVILMKGTLAFFVLVPGAVYVARRTRLRREWMFLVIPATFYLLVSIGAGLNLGVRYVLVIFPYLIVMAGAAASYFAARSRAGAYVVALLLIAHAASSLAAYPNYLTYSNELAGGPSKTYRVMADSNVDWGQGLKQAAAYLAERHVTDCWFDYRNPSVEPRFYGVPCKRLESGSGYLALRLAPAHPAVVEGTVLISANEATGEAWGPDELNPYRTFFDRKPDDMIGNSILVFDGRFDVSLAAAHNHAGRAQKLLNEGHEAGAQDKRLEEALVEAKQAVGLAPDSAETQATLCLVERRLGQTQTDACDTAMRIARRVHPEYQFLRMPAVQAVAAMNEGR